MVDCIHVKVDEGIPAREMYNNESSTKDTAKDEDEQVQESENKTLNQMKTQILRQSQISRLLQIPPPELLKRIILQVI
jgi:hypothetical protein